MSKLNFQKYEGARFPLYLFENLLGAIPLSLSTVNTHVSFPSLEKKGAKGERGNIATLIPKF